MPNRLPKEWSFDATKLRATGKDNSGFYCDVAYIDEKAVMAEVGIDFGAPQLERCGVWSYGKDRGEAIARAEKMAVAIGIALPREGTDHE